MKEPLSIAIIGAGPRGLTVCERLSALAPRYAGDVSIHVIDPYPPGAGRVWNPAQPAELLMNTTISEQTVFPDDSCEGLVPTNTGPSMQDWYLARGGQDSPGSTFAPRRLYGEYLADAFAHITSSAPANVTFNVHRAEAHSISQPGALMEEPQLVRLSDGSSLEADCVVLCVGHIASKLTDERVQFDDYAESTGLNYCPPSLPAETPVELVPPGETVIFRGFGLNYFDLQALFTHARGGTFVPAPTDAEPWRLVYHPSGHEPILAPSSRRGVPYRCKPITPAHPMAPYPLRFFTPDNVETLASGRQLHFDDQLWPLILADLRFAWYATLHRRHPQAFTGETAHITEALTEAVDRHLTRRTGAETQSGRTTGRETREAPAWHKLLDSVVKPEYQLRLEALLRPLDNVQFAHRGQLTAWMEQFLEDELRDAYLGPELAPNKAVFSVLWAARAFLKQLVAHGRVSQVSFATEIRGWFEAFVSGICDGPPPQRFAELLALSKAGLVTFVGPQVRISTQKGSTHAAFVACSPEVAGTITARHLIDAASPANQVRLAGDTLIASMLDRGQLTVATVTGDDGVLIPSAGPAVERDTLRTVDARGRVHPNRYLMSIQLSDVQLGLAIAANPNSNAQTLRDAHMVATQIFDL